METIGQESSYSLLPVLSKSSSLSADLTDAAALTPRADLQNITPSVHLNTSANNTSSSDLANKVNGNVTIHTPHVRKLEQVSQAYQTSEQSTSVSHDLKVSALADHEGQHEVGKSAISQEREAIRKKEDYFSLDELHYMQQHFQYFDEEGER